MRKKFLGFIALPLLLVGCGASDFESFAQKETAFEEALCQTSIESGTLYGPRYAMRAIGDVRSSDEDMRAAMDIIYTDQAKAKRSWEVWLKNPDYEPIASERLDPLEDGVCQGWLWEQHLAERAGDIDDFTYQDAVDAGVL